MAPVEDLEEADVLKRGYIFCPICGEKLYPELTTFTDNTIYGEWTCYGCSNTFIFESIEHLTESAHNFLLKQKPQYNQDEVVRGKVNNNNKKK